MRNVGCKARWVMNLSHKLMVLVAAAELAGGCTDDVTFGSIEAPGMLNGMLNGFYHPEGLAAFLANECPALGQRLLASGNLTASFPKSAAAELELPTCEHFLFYSAQLMVPQGQNLTIFAGGEAIATFAGRMGLQRIVRIAHPTYTFAHDSFGAAFPVARIVATQGYAALTNGITRRVSYKTNDPALDAHRAPIEDTWPREFTQLVPFTQTAIAAMATQPALLARMPDFFRPCDPAQTNYDYLIDPEPPCKDTDTALTGKLGLNTLVTCQHAPLPGPMQLLPPPPDGYCPIPVVVHGNLDFVDDVIPGRSCRILRPGETLPANSSLSGDVIVPDGGCPLIYYAGRDPSEIIYDNRAVNPAGTDDGCDALGPSLLDNCDFDVVDTDGTPIPDAFLDYYVFNVEPIAP